VVNTQSSVSRISFMYKYSAFHLLGLSQTKENFLEGNEMPLEFDILWKDCYHLIYIVPFYTKCVA
jgi:hypothetical protein